jgi:hypothetical protein
MWDTTNLDLNCPLGVESLRVWSRGIPHLAKNERDVGHPRSVADPDMYGLKAVPFMQNGNLSMEVQPFSLGTEAEDQEKTKNHTHLEDGKRPLIAKMPAEGELHDH